ncbi:SDR family oxidoreductase [Streptomyces olivoreticuli]
MKSVLVTGTTSGIGLATARELMARGYDVIGTALPGEDSLPHLQDIRCLRLDVTDPRSCHDCFTAAAELTGGGPWALVNNAGIASPAAFEDTDDDTARRTLETNVLGAARMTRLALPSMRRRGEGRVVNVSSLAGLVPLPLQGWYSADKHALEALTDVLRMETARHGIRFSLIEPGLVDTPMVTHALANFPTNTAYSGAYHAATRLLDILSPLPGPERTARTIARALDARRPRRRYRVGRERFLVRLGAMVPAAARDWAVRTALGL